MNRILKLLSVLFVVAALFAICSMSASAYDMPTGIEVTGYDYDVDYSALMNKCLADGSTHAMQMGVVYETQRNLKIQENNMPYAATTYFYDYNSVAEIKAAQDRDKRAQVFEKRYRRMNQEYGAAASVYSRLYHEGFTDQAIAGILGNMMSECGGHTLDLQWSIYGPGGYYGLCQWSLYYNPYIDGTGVDYQLDYLMSNIESQFKAYGGNFESFKNSTDERAAAYEFCRCYERGENGVHRQNNATTALKWIQK